MSSERDYQVGDKVWWHLPMSGNVPVEIASVNTEFVRIKVITWTDRDPTRRTMLVPVDRSALSPRTTAESSGAGEGQ